MVIKRDGWTKSAMQKLKKVDSFMRESQRVNGINCRMYLVDSHRLPKVNSYQQFL